MIGIERITKITRERDSYFFYIDNKETHYTFEVNNGRVLGQKNNCIKTNPFGTTHGISFITALYNVTTQSEMYGTYDYLVMREYIDRIITSEDFTANEKLHICSAFCSYRYNLEDSLKNNWRKVLNYLKTHKDIIRFEHRVGTIHEEFEKETVKELLGKYNIDGEILTQYTSVETCKTILETKPLRDATKALLKRAEKVEEVRTAILNAAGVPDVNTLGTRYGISITDEEDAKKTLYNKIRYLPGAYNDCLQYIRRMSLENFEFSEDIFADRNRLKELFQTNQERYYAETFARNQTSNLFFEDDNYKIFIPTTYEQLIEIGRYFNNCAADYEWRNYLREGHRSLVVVVDKKDDKWVVCVDMVANNHSIQQYLGKNNSNISKLSLRDFKEKYQEYLNTL